MRVGRPQPLPEPLPWNELEPQVLDQIQLHWPDMWAWAKKFLRARVLVSTCRETTIQAAIMKLCQLDPRGSDSLPLHVLRHCHHAAQAYATERRAGTDRLRKDREDVKAYVKRRPDVLGAVQEITRVLAGHPRAAVGDLWLVNILMQKTVKGDPAPFSAASGFTYPDLWAAFEHVFARPHRPFLPCRFFSPEGFTPSFCG